MTRGSAELGWVYAAVISLPRPKDQLQSVIEDFFQRITWHITGPLLHGPLVGLLKQDNADQVADRRLGGEDADILGAVLGLVIQALNGGCAVIRKRPVYY